MTNRIKKYYDDSVEIEWSRLDRHPFEFEITKRHIDEFITCKSKIADIGGGPGKYSFYFAEKKHEVTLVDLSPKNIEFANQKQKELGITLQNTYVGNAINLSFLESESFDVVLCMGPLYHLVNEEDRIKVVQECKRIVKKNGIIVFSFITAMAQTISLLKRNSDKIDEWYDHLNKNIETGINDPDFDTGFTEAYFIHPFQIEPFINKNNLELLKLAGAEGFSNQSEEVLLKLPKDKLEKWIDFNYKYSEDKSILGANQHIISVVKKRS